MYGSLADKSAAELQLLETEHIYLRSEREADHSFPFSTEVKNAWNYTSAHPVYLIDVEA
jgi:hypothetical protein